MGGTVCGQTRRRVDHGRRSLGWAADRRTVQQHHTFPPAFPPFHTLAQLPGAGSAFSQHTCLGCGLHTSLLPRAPQFIWTFKRRAFTRPPQAHTRTVKGCLLHLPHLCTALPGTFNALAHTGPHYARLWVGHARLRRLAPATIKRATFCNISPFTAANDFLRAFLTVPAHHAHTCR